MTLLSKVHSSIANIAIISGRAETIHIFAHHVLLYTVLPLNWQWGFYQVSVINTYNLDIHCHNQSKILKSLWLIPTATRTSSNRCASSTDITNVLSGLSVKRLQIVSYTTTDTVLASTWLQQPKQNLTDIKYWLAPIRITKSIWAAQIYMEMFNKLRVLQWE